MLRARQAERQITEVNDLNDFIINRIIFISAIFFIPLGVLEIMQGTFTGEFCGIALIFWAACQLTTIIKFKDE